MVLPRIACSGGEDVAVTQRRKALPHLLVTCLLGGWRLEVSRHTRADDVNSRFVDTGVSDGISRGRLRDRENGATT